MEDVSELDLRQKDPHFEKKSQRGNQLTRFTWKMLI